MIIISLIAANFAPENRRKIIAWGVAAAFIFRIMFATGANFIFEFAWVKILGGVLLLWVINNLRQDFFGRVDCVAGNCLFDLHWHRQWQLSRSRKRLLCALIMASE